MNEYTCDPNAVKLETGNSLAIQSHWISEPQVGLESLLKTNKQIINKVESGRGKKLMLLTFGLHMIIRMLVDTHKQAHVYSRHTRAAKHYRISQVGAVSCCSKYSPVPWSEYGLSLGLSHTSKSADS